MCTWQQSIKNRERERERERETCVIIFIIIPPAKKLKYDSEIMKSYIYAYIYSILSYHYMIYHMIISHSSYFLITPVFVFYDVFGNHILSFY